MREPDKRHTDRRIESSGLQAGELHSSQAAALCLYGLQLGLFPRGVQPQERRRPEMGPLCELRTLCDRLSVPLLSTLAR